MKLTLLHRPTYWVWACCIASCIIHSSSTSTTARCWHATCGEMVCTRLRPAYGVHSDAIPHLISMPQLLRALRYQCLLSAGHVPYLPATSVQTLRQQTTSFSSTRQYEQAAHWFIVVSCMSSWGFGSAHRHRQFAPYFALSLSVEVHGRLLCTLHSTVQYTTTCVQ